MSNASISSQSQSKMYRDDKSCHRRRQVSFSTEADDMCYLRDVAPSSIMTNEERASAWYTYDDMICMKNEAWALARRLRINTRRSTLSTPPLSNDDRSCTNIMKRRLDERYPSNLPPSTGIEEKNSEDCRGLELLISQGRQLKKYIAALTIMEYQRRYKLKIAIAVEQGDLNVRVLTEAASISLGCVSAKCSQWARDVALVTGYSDFKSVYEKCETPSLASSVQKLLRVALKRKRQDVIASSVEEFEMNRHSKRKIFDTKSSSDSHISPIDRILQYTRRQYILGHALR